MNQARSSTGVQHSPVTNNADETLVALTCAVHG
jgi:hypothetical protein